MSANSESRLSLGDDHGHGHHDRGYGGYHLEFYRARLRRFSTLSHITVEVSRV